ncbi:MAG: hypothetical protein COA94_01685 [Rickettsiales bacterium]|nr:MAG: hypothetical protein COA94_01685 [Rickettsiales bacterium]
MAKDVVGDKFDLFLYAVGKGDIETVTLFTDKTNAEIISALVVAAQNNRAEMVRLLLKNLALKNLDQDLSSISDIDITPEVWKQIQDFANDKDWEIVVSEDHASHLAGRPVLGSTYWGESSWWGIVIECFSSIFPDENSP